MRVLVTGSDGFIGRHVVTSLKRFCDVDTYDIVDGEDVCVDDIPGADLIVHLAGHVSSIESVENPIADFRVNAYGTVRVLEAARQFGAPVIYASSCKVYAAANGGRTPYGAAKYAGDIFCQEYAATYNLPVIINRLSTVYGPGQEGSPESGWLTWFIKCAKEDLELTIYGDGLQTRDPIYIDDLVDLITLQVAAPKQYRGIWDVGSGLAGRVTLLEVVAMLNSLRGKNMEIKQGPARPSDLPYFVSTQTIPGWQPRIFPLEGIRRLFKCEY